MILRTAARKIAPGLMAERSRRFERRYREALGIPDLARRLEPVVQAGPFAGLRYPDRFEEIDAPVAKLLGTYERELHPIIEAHRGPFYDIGSADGYYAVGMARRGHPVVAWDVSAGARDLCAEVAALNGVEVEQRGEYFGEPLAGDGLVLCDIEGGEADLFDRFLVPRLPDVLIEVHEDSRPGTSAWLRDTFSATHEVRPIRQSPRTPPRAIKGWSAEDQTRAFGEFRPPYMHWLYFTRRD